MTDASLVNFFLHRAPSERPFACVPMGTLYLCSALREAGYTVDFHDYQLQTGANPYDPETIASFLARCESSLIGISCMTNMLPFLILGLRILKQRRPETFVVLGGSAASGLAREILSRYPEVDAVVSGEGEQAIVEIVEARAGRRGWSSILGLAIRDGHAVVANPTRPRVMEVDRIPYPAYDLLNLEHYLNFPLLTARGCPYRCTFCDIAPNWDRRVGQRTVLAVIHEIQMLQERFGTTTISILDDVFSLNRKRVVEFCDALLQHRIDIEWSCMCRVDLLDDELIDLMYEAGCRKVFLGIESGSDRVRKIAGKGLRIDNVEELIARCAGRFEVAASFILGFPFETLDDFRETLYLIMYCAARGARPQMSILSPLPQAELTSSEYTLEFDPALVSGMVFPRYQERAGRMLQSILTPNVQSLIVGDAKVFSAFYHFKEGHVQKKLELALRYGLQV